MKRPKPSCPVGLLQHGETSPTFLLPPPGPASGPSPHSTSSINSFVSLSFGIPPTPCPSTLLPLLSRPFRCNLLGCRRHRTTPTLSLPTPPSVYDLAAHFLPLPCAVPSRLCTNVACTVPPRTPHPTLRVRPFGSVPLSFRVRPPRALSPSLRARPCHAPPPSLRAPLNRYLPFPFSNPTRWILLHGSFPSYPSDRACCPITCTAALPRPCPPLSCGPTVHSPLILVRPHFRPLRVRGPASHLLPHFVRGPAAHFLARPDPAPRLSSRSVRGPTAHLPVHSSPAAYALPRVMGAYASRSSVHPLHAPLRACPCPSRPRPYSPPRFVRFPTMHSPIYSLRDPAAYPPARSGPASQPPSFRAWPRHALPRSSNAFPRHHPHSPLFRACPHRALPRPFWPRP